MLLTKHTRRKFELKSKTWITNRINFLLLGIKITHFIIIKDKNYEQIIK